ncbi:M23 family metallopeptidase [Novosphingobium colocasiae]|uniref:M23 family metallopeptidase n=1 Tax=Novosphingobium colocasiae TaxID=1256513 RepID=UPI0035B3DA0C
MVSRRQSLGLAAAGLAGGLLALRQGRGLILPSAAAAAKPIELLLPGALTQGGWLRGRTTGQALSLDGRPVALADDGMFLIAFDRDARPAALLTARLEAGGTAELPLTVAPRAWQIENVNIARRGGGPTDDFMAIRAPELARIAAARALQTGAQGWRQKFMWPAKGRISGKFGSQRVYRGEPGAYHSGLDIATGASGTPYVAPADGVVILAAERPFTLEGNLLMLDHGMGLNSAFLHSSQLLVKEGDVVRQGQVIARIGMTGRATGPHLHWSMKWGDARLDPLLFTGPMA